MKLTTKKTEANLAHIRWASTHIRVINALVNLKIDKENLIHPDLNEQEHDHARLKSAKTVKVQDEKRISIEDLTSNTFGQNSDIENIASLAKDVLIIFLYLIAYLPYRLIKYLFWDLIFKR